MKLHLIFPFLLFCFAVLVSGQNRGLHVQGTKVLEANGNQFIMRGVNHPHTWFSSQLGTAIPAIAAHRITVDNASSVMPRGVLHFVTTSSPSKSRTMSTAPSFSTM